MFYSPMTPLAPLGITILGNTTEMYWGGESRAR